MQLLGYFNYMLASEIKKRVQHLFDVLYSPHKHSIKVFFVGRNISTLFNKMFEITPQHVIFIVKDMPLTLL